MAHKPKFGLHAALVTPFDASGDIDLPRMATHARSVIDCGCDGVTLFGTTGEGFGLSPTERHDALAAVADALPSGVKSRLCSGTVKSYWVPPLAISPSVRDFSSFRQTPVPISSVVILLPRQHKRSVSNDP